MDDRIMTNMGSSGTRFSPKPKPKRKRQPMPPTMTVGLPEWLKIVLAVLVTAFLAIWIHWLVLLVLLLFVGWTRKSNDDDERLKRLEERLEEKERDNP